MMSHERMGLAAVLLLSGMAVASLPLRAQNKPTVKPQRKQTVTTKKPMLLACNLNAMNPAQRKRHDQIAARLRKAAVETKELPDGFAFRYTHDPKLFVQIAEFVSLESLCCSFYRFTLEKEPAEGAMWLRVTGPKEAKSFIKPVLAP